jgi:hypothetical protein
VGVGSSNFKPMEILDADEKGAGLKVYHPDGRVQSAERDIVQFVSMRMFQDNRITHTMQQAQLAQALLAEVPKQYHELCLVRIHEFSFFMQIYASFN